MAVVLGYTSVLITELQQPFDYIFSASLHCVTRSNATAFSILGKRAQLAALAPMMSGVTEG